MIKQGQEQLRSVLDKLQPLYRRSEGSAASLLLHEVVSAPRPAQAPSSSQHTPLRHGIAAVHSYISMFLHTCKASQVRRPSLDCTNLDYKDKSCKCSGTPSIRRNLWLY